MSKKIKIDERVLSTLVKEVIKTNKRVKDLSERLEYNKEQLLIPDLEAEYELSLKTTNPNEKRKFQNLKAKVKIKNVGDLCRKCSVPVITKVPKNRPLKPNQTYYFEYYLFCPECKTIYHVEEAKTFV